MKATLKIEANDSGLGELLRHLTELVDEGAALVYKGKGLQYRPRYTPVMRALAAGECTVSDITAQLAITQGAVSQSLKLMEKDGLVKRRPGPDARQTLIKLNAKGRRLFAPLADHWRATFVAIDQLENEIEAPLRDVLRRTVAALEQKGFSERIQNLERDKSTGAGASKVSRTRKKQQHFLTGGKDYAHYRPTYPPEVAAKLSALCPSRSLAIDVGCGSGQFSTLLAAHFNQVIATDVSADQLAHAQLHPKVDYRCEPAEAISAKDNSADLIIAAQAAHWFDLPRFYDEVRRVAKPGAVIALISYGVPSLEGGVNALLQQFYWQALAPYWPAERQHVETGYLELPYPFERIPVRECTIEREWNLEALLGYLSTWSATRRAIADGHADILNQFGQRLQTLWGDADAAKKVTWPVNMRVGRV